MSKSKQSTARPSASLLVAVLVLQGCNSESDTSPDAFGFRTRSGVAPGITVESDAVAISGIDAPAKVSISDGEYSIDGGAYTSGDGKVENSQKIRIRLQSPSASLGVLTANLTVGGASGSFTVRTVKFSGRVEAETASLLGNATTVTDGVASHAAAVFVGSAGLGVSVTESLDAVSLTVGYRTDTTGALEASVNGASIGTFSLQPTGGVYASSSMVVSVDAGDVVAFRIPSGAGSSETYIDYVEFSDSPLGTVSTLAQTTSQGKTDGVAVAANGDIYVSGGPTGQDILRVTPGGQVSTFVTGLGSANGSDFDSSGNLYVADYASNAIRKITPQGSMSTFASGLDGPGGVWVDPNDYVFVSLFGADYSGTGATVLRIAPNGAVSTYATGGGLQDVIGIVGDGSGQVYATNWSTGAFFNITGGHVTAVSSTGGSSNHICYRDGYIYIPSPGSALIRRVTPDGTVTDFIGTAARQTVDGPIAEADFERPNSCAFTPDGTVMYVMDRDNGKLRKVEFTTP